MKKPGIGKVLIANRGEIAVRIIRTCREMSIRTVAVFSEADRTTPHVLMADEAYFLGAAPARESYLRGEKVVEIAAHAGVDAIHPGYGFLSENADFARLVEESGLVFIGPHHSSIRKMGDKTAARRLMESAGIPVVPGTADPVSSPEEAAGICRGIGFPVLIKAAGGGGGKGMRVAKNAAEVPALYRAARSEAASAFGDDRVYVEKFIERPRHVEFQILADHHGNIIHLGERECSIQRRHQKVVEESPSCILDDDLRQRMAAAAVGAAKACDYVNAGTIEFLVDGQRSFYFLEMNTRLQVEHPVTEMRTGLDLVAEQIRIANGEPLRFRQSDVQWNGHSIECRIYAEDPRSDYLPSTGRIEHLRPASGPGVRDDRGVDEGGEISVYYDPLISKLVVWSNTRADAINRMKRALREYEVLGVSTNIPLNLAIMNDPRFVEGDVDTCFLDRPDALFPSSIPDEAERKAAAILAGMLRRQQLREQADQIRQSTGTDGWAASRFRSSLE